MFNEKYLPYFKSVNSLNLTAEKRSFIVAAAVAAAIAYRAAVPFEKVNSPEAFFSANIAVAARATIGEFHGVAILNFDAAYELTRKFWLVRYNMLHRPQSVIFKAGRFADSFGGFMTEFSEQELCLLNELAETFVRVNSAVISVLESVAE